MASPARRVLCVDDNEDTLFLLSTLLEQAGFQTRAVRTITEGLEIARNGSFALYLLDSRLEDGTGIELCRSLREFDQQTPILFFSALAHPRDHLEGLRAGAQGYLNKPNGINELVDIVKCLVTRTHEDHPKDIHKGLDRLIALVNNQADPGSIAHVQPHAHATAKLAKHFALACGLRGGGKNPSPAEIEFGALTHDIGKYLIDPSLLLKPGEYDGAEREIMSRHPVEGAAIVSALPGSTETMHNAVLHHHERWDGTGYPDGLSGTKIPLEARIVAIADVYTALRAKRTYKPTFTRAETFELLGEMSGKELDPALVEDFLKLAGRE